MRLTFLYALKQPEYISDISSKCVVVCQVFLRSFTRNFLHSSRNPKCQTRCTILHRHTTSCEISGAHGRQDEAAVATYGMFFWLLVPGVNIWCVDLKNLSCFIAKRQIVLVTLQWLEVKVNILATKLQPNNCFNPQFFVFTFSENF